MTQRHFARWFGALGLTLVLVGMVSQGTTSAQTLAETQQRANEGDAHAQATLGFVYENGEGVPENLMQAVVWYRIAADQDYAPAQANLGVMYSNGQGVPQDDVEAHKWLSLAVSSLTGDRQKGYAEYRNAMAKQMTPAQLAEAQRLAREWQAAFEKQQAE